MVDSSPTSRSFEVKSSVMRKKPPGSEMSEASFQNVESSSRDGSAEPGAGERAAGTCASIGAASAKRTSANQRNERMLTEERVAVRRPSSNVFRKALWVSRNDSPQVHTDTRGPANRTDKC